MKIAYTFLLVFLLSSSAHVHAQSLLGCHESINTELAKEHAIFRSVLHGEPELDVAPIGHTVLLKDGTMWIKVEDNQWKSAAIVHQSTVRTDATIEPEVVVEPRRGVYETKRVLASELVPYIVEGVRTFDCRLRSFCSSIQKSMTEKTASGSTIEITLPGCEPQMVQTLPVCTTTTEVVQATRAIDAYTYCTDVQVSLFDRELELIQATTEYDASYRSTLQFAGDFDQFIAQLRWPMTNTIRHIVQLIGTFQRLPCFIATCDEFSLPHTNEDN